MLHFLHVLSVIVWFGGVLTLNVLALRVGRGPDQSVQGALLRMSDLYGRAVIAPAGVLTLITGIRLVIEDDLSFTTLWVVKSLTRPSRLGLLEATAIRATQETSVGLPRARMGTRSVAWPGGPPCSTASTLLILLSMVWAMVFKPTV